MKIPEFKDRNGKKATIMGYYKAAAPKKRTSAGPVVACSIGDIIIGYACPKGWNDMEITTSLFYNVNTGEHMKWGEKYETMLENIKNHLVDLPLSRYQEIQSLHKPETETTDEWW